MQREIEAGRLFELESTVGVVRRKGRQEGVPMPTADRVCAVLLPSEAKDRRNAA